MESVNPYLNNSAQNNHHYLGHGPCLNIAGVVLDQVKISGFSSPGHGLELPHHLEHILSYFNPMIEKKGKSKQ